MAIKSVTVKMKKKSSNSGTCRYLAVDLGAESGRVILGTITPGGKVVLEELHRFPTGNIRLHGRLYWDILGLYREIITGLRVCAARGFTKINSIGIDTWGVDYALFNKNGELLANPYAYRDSRTDGMMEKVFARVGKRNLYNHTGIQFMQFNTVFQLYSAVLNNDPLLKNADALLFIPDILNYFLTGKMAAEFTFATTSQLYNPVTRGWDKDVFKKLGLNINLMRKIVQPGTVIGKLTDEICRLTGLEKTNVVAVGSHDTASAVAAVPAEDMESCAYISSGTWSLMGIETRNPVINDETYKYNFTNEGGVCGTFRVLKNIMGLWLLQECRRDWEKKLRRKYTFAELMNLALKIKPLSIAVIDPDNSIFLNPVSMTGTISSFCRKSGQKVPYNPGEYTRCIYDSLALDYRYAGELINTVSSRNLSRLHIIGGGAKDEVLSQLTADFTQMEVITGPVEATAVGNILLQSIASRQCGSLKTARKLIRNSFPTLKYVPSKKQYPGFTDIYKKFVNYKNTTMR